MRLGILGGTFDPIHVAHLRMAEEAREALRLDRVLFIPVGQPPHRAKPAASARDRLAMVRLAVAGHAAFAASDLEVRREGKSYTVDTLDALRRAHPRARLFLILGADQAADLSTWRHTQRLLSLCRLVVLTRPGVPFPGVLTLPGDGGGPPRPALCTTLDVTPMDISATRIRRLLRQGKSLRYLVPDPVLTYIRRRRLYAGDASARR